MLRLPRMFRSIENRNYRLYFFGQMVSVLGSWLQSVALAWLVYRLTGSSFQLGLVFFIGQAHLLFLSPIGGLIADRYRRRWLVVATQTSSMLLAFVLAALALLGHIQLWQILFVAGLQGIISAIDVPTRQALVTEMVETDNLLNAVALNSSIFNNFRGTRYSRVSRGNRRGRLVLRHQWSDVPGSYRRALTDAPRRTPEASRDAIALVEHSRRISFRTRHRTNSTNSRSPGCSKPSRCAIYGSHADFCGQNSGCRAAGTGSPDERKRHRLPDRLSLACIQT